MRGRQRVLTLHPNYHLEPSFASNGYGSLDRMGPLEAPGLPAGPIAVRQPVSAL